MLISGGARGADTAWEQYARSKGLEVQHYVVSGSTTGTTGTTGATRYVVPPHMLATADPILEVVAKQLQRPYPCRYKEYLQRNVFIVAHVQAVYAIGKAVVTARTLDIEGGTAWPVEIFKLCYAERHIRDTGSSHLYFYNQYDNKWYVYVGSTQWSCIDRPPAPTIYSIFAGVGSRDITNEGLAAIAAL